LLYCLDTNCCILIIAQRSPALNARVQSRAPGDIVLSAIVAAELVRGLTSVDSDSAARIDSMFETFPVVPFDEAAARAFSRVPFRRAKFDRLIAAHALALGVTLVTANPKDFKDVPGLAVEDWTR
jgi:tRNA(fMet)-specific endonuclease VapC